MTRENYITETCVSEFKDLDGNILSMVSYIDADLEAEDLIDMDDGIREILDEEDEDSAAILEENQYDLIICSMI